MQGIERIKNSLIRKECELLFSQMGFYGLPINAPLLQQKILNIVNTAKAQNDFETAEYVEKQLFSSKIMTGIVSSNRQAIGSYGEMQAANFNLGGHSAKSDTGGCQGAGCNDEVKTPTAEKKHLELSFMEPHESDLVEDLTVKKDIFKTVLSYKDDVTRCKSAEEVGIFFGLGVKGHKIAETVLKMKTLVSAFDLMDKEAMSKLSKSKKTAQELAELIFENL